MLSKKKFYSTRNSNAFFLLIFLIGIPLFSLAQISGVVYKDYNSNGTMDLPNENTLPAITVRAYLSSTQVLTKVTNAQGFYSFSNVEVPFGTPVRLEFDNLGGYSAGLKGFQSNSKVYFTNGGDLNASLGVLATDEYCGFDGPDILTSCYVNGNPLGGGSAGEDIAIVTYPYTASGLAGKNGAPSLKYVAKIREVGSVWGMAYQASSKQFLVSALVRRHSGLGPLGTGGIYKVNDATSNAVNFIDVKTLGINTGDDPHFGLPADKLIPNEDSLTSLVTGKVGIGGITLSQDEKTLYFVNLFDRKLYGIEAGVPLSSPSVNSSVLSYTIPDPSGTGDYRPWAITERFGELYVGVVNSGENSQNSTLLKAYVYKLDKVTGIFTEVFSFPLDYLKGPSDNSGDCYLINKWLPWTNVFPSGCSQFFDNGKGKVVNFVMHPQPILSSINFDGDGSMIIGLMDRFSLNTGFRNLRPKDDGMLYDGFVAGDILRAQFDAFTNTYELESNGKSGDLTGTGVGNNQGPGGGEFFGRDVWNFFEKPAHEEITNGASLLIPGLNELIVSAMDPVDEIYQSGGVRVFNPKNGELIRSFALYSDVPGTLGKSGGVGQFKVQCDGAPLEIGNRIWIDNNRDGIQDPNEAGLNGVEVTLHDMDNGGVEIGKMGTSENGNFYFNSQNTPSIKYNTNYELRVNCKQGPFLLEGIERISPQYGDSSPNGTERDSNGEKIGDFAVITLNSGFPGNVQHSFDIGFIKCSPPIPANPLQDLEYCLNKLPNINLEDAPQGAKWTIANSSTTVSITEITGLVTGINAAGVYKFYLSNILDFQCRDSVIITVKETPFAGEDFEICSSQSSITLQGSPTNGIWRIASGNPSTVTFNESSGLISQMKGIGVYNFIYRYGGCEDTISVTRKLKPNAGKDSTICNFVKQIQLVGSPQGGTWQVAIANTKQSTISSTGLVSNFQGTSEYLYIYKTANCVDTVKISVIDCQLASIGDNTWLDINRNGSFDIGEEPLPGVTVTLCNENYNPVALDGLSNAIVPKVTDQNGLYEFNNLIPGKYTIKFSKPEGYIFTILKSDTLTKDSDADPITGRTGIYTLIGGENNKTVDAGYIPQGEIGNFVWYDNDDNGIQDSNESGVEGVVMELYRQEINNDLTLISSIATDTNGKYLFNNLPSGIYHVKMGSNIPSGFKVSTKVFEGNDLLKDNNFNYLTGLSDEITLDVSSANTRSRLDIDGAVVDSCVTTCIIIKINKTK